MTDLTPNTRALLDLGRAGDDPTDDAVSRNRRSLSVKLGAAVLGSGIVAGSTTKAAAAAAGTWSVAKLALVCGSVLVGGALTLGAIRLQHGAPPTPRAPVASSPSALAPTAAAVQHVDSESEPGAAVAQPAVAPPVPRATPSSHSPGPQSIQDELELIRGAQRLLNRNDPRAALLMLSQHAQRFPSGALWEEREASRVFALCKMGDAPAARASAEAFVKKAPRSAFVDRVNAACRAPLPASAP